MRDEAPDLAEGDAPAVIERHTRRWIQRFVVGLNLCPFAAPLFRDGLFRDGLFRDRSFRDNSPKENLPEDNSANPSEGPLRIAVCAQTRPRPMAEAVLAELELLRATPADAPLTSVLVFSKALRDFDDYLDFLALAEELLFESGLEGVLQIASFHPDYQFDGAQAQDVANFTNRAPYPMLHFLREEAVSQVLERYPAPEQIPLRNIERLQTMGIDAVQSLLRDIEHEL